MSDSDTRLLGLIGDPVSHSLSPELHSFLLYRAGLNYCYLAFQVPKERLLQAMEGMRALGIKGFNVTIPHKEAVISYLDWLSPETEIVGAVNTVVNEGGRFLGYNTDVYGFLAPLRARGLQLRGVKAVVVGAGGAAAAVIWGLLKEGAKVAIVNRTLERAAALARKFSQWGPVSAHPIAAISELLPAAELLVHATPVGMHPHPDEVAIPPELIHEGLLVYDLVYRPLQTKLLSEAASRGAETLGGLEMLVWQGLRSLELWTGRRFQDEDGIAALIHLQEVLRG